MFSHSKLDRIHWVVVKNMIGNMAKGLPWIDKIDCKVNRLWLPVKGLSCYLDLIKIYSEYIYFSTSAHDLLACHNYVILNDPYLIILRYPYSQHIVKYDNLRCNHVMNSVCHRLAALLILIAHTIISLISCMIQMRK